MPIAASILIQDQPKLRDEFVSHCEEEGSDEDKATALFNGLTFFEIKLNVLSTVFDDDNSGTMDFSEFLMASNALKLRLNFSPLCANLT